MLNSNNANEEKVSSRKRKYLFDERYVKHKKSLIFFIDKIKEGQVAYKVQKLVICKPTLEQKLLKKNSIFKHRHPFHFIATPPNKITNLPLNLKNYNYATP